MSAAAVAKVTQLIGSAPVVVFSKTYCPFCSRALELLKDSMKLNPAPLVIQLDEEADGEDMQEALFTLTNQRTVPNVFVGGLVGHIGGCDDTFAAKASGKLQRLLQDAQVTFTAV